jgi:hypothetical protein
LSLEGYDHFNFGFLRLEISKTQIVGTYLSAPAALPGGEPPTAKMTDGFTVDLERHTVQTNSTQGQSSGAKRAPKRAKTGRAAKKTGSAAKAKKSTKRSPAKRAKKTRR